MIDDITDAGIGDDVSDKEEMGDDVSDADEIGDDVDDAEEIIGVDVNDVEEIIGADVSDANERVGSDVSDSDCVALFDEIGFGDTVVSVALILMAGSYLKGKTVLEAPLYFV